MDLEVQAAATELRIVARSLLSERASSEKIRALFDDPLCFDRDLWSEMSNLGWLAIEVPEEFGGSGVRFEYLAVILEELGRVAAGGPFLSTAVLAVGAVLRFGTDRQQQQWLPPMASGDVVGAAALAEYFGYRSAGSGVIAMREGACWRLSGRCDYVLDAGSADLMIVIASDAIGSPLLFVVDDLQTCADVRIRPTLDLTRSVGTVTFDGVVLDEERCLLAAGVLAKQAIDMLRNRAAVAIACDALGNASRVLDMTTAYVKERTQFGRPIGSFQAVKHQCADVLLGVEGSRALVDAAVEVIASQDHQLSPLPSMAKAHVCEVAAHAAGRGVQLHGGIGYTWEHDMHVMLKRAKMDQALFGDTRWHRRWVGDLTLPTVDHGAAKT